MRLTALLITAVLLAGCGVDGEPVRPTLNTSVGVGKGGVHTSTRVGARVGPVNLGVGLGL